MMRKRASDEKEKRRQPEEAKREVGKEKQNREKRRDPEKNE